MPRHKPTELPSRRARAALRLAAAGSVLSLLAVLGAYAQQAAGIRGGISGDPAAASATATGDEGGDGRRDDTAAAAAPNASLFDDPVGESDDAALSDPLLPAPRAPSTKRLRARSAAEPALGSTAAPAREAADGEAVAVGADEEAVEPDAAASARVEREKFGGIDAQGEGRAEHALAIEALPRGNAVEANPFEPVGVRAGGFLLRPSVETGLTASSNAARTPTGSPGVLSESTLRLSARSDWSEHTATLDGFGTFRRSLSGEEKVKDVEGGIEAALQLDLGEEWQARGGLAYSVRPESASAIDAVADAEEQPLRQDLQAEAGLDKAVGKLRLGGTVSVERDWYGEAALADGGTADQSGRDSTLGLVKLRTGYAVSPAVTPFVEAEVGRRFYDETGATDRSANRVGARAGVALDLREKLSGEFAAGWLRESFENDDLAPIEGPSLAAALRWSPIRATVVALTAATTAEGTTTAGESGSLVQDLRLDVERTLRANLTARAGLGASYRDYSGTDGHDLTLVVDAGATWWLNRWVGLTGRLRHERLDSNLPGRDYKENSVFVGTRLQY